MPGSIDDTADEVTPRGRPRHRGALRSHRRRGRGAPASHASSATQGRLDLLVNNAWGGHEAFTGVFDAPFWEHPLDHWEAMFDHGVRNHLLASRRGRPSMLQRASAA